MKARYGYSDDQARIKGQSVKFFLFADDRNPPYGTSIISTRKMVETRPDVL